MTETIDRRLARPLRIWLYLVAFLIAVMVLIGGATRLTESGLSITEWKPVSGTLPPLSEQSWQEEFRKYRQIPQYRALNSGMTLGEFKTIYWWEWAHRFLGRLIGLAYALPFFFFALRRTLPQTLLLKLGGILLLGGLQGAIGWWMVASGLADRVEVAPYRLAIHLTLALIIFACVLRVAFSLDRSTPTLTLPLSGGGNKSGAHQNSSPHETRQSFDLLNASRIYPTCDGRRLGGGSILLLLVFLQIFLGGLVAGTRAGYAYNTWPLMDGGLIPSGLFAIEPWWRNFFENTAMVQFLHRMDAYLIFLFAFVLHMRDRKNKALSCLLAALLVQMSLGIAALLTHMNFALALAHQAGIIVVLVFAIKLLIKKEFTIPYR